MTLALVGVDLWPQLPADSSFHLGQDQCVLSLCSGQELPTPCAGTSFPCSLPQQDPADGASVWEPSALGEGAPSSQLTRTSHSSHLCSLVPSGVFTHVFFLPCLLRRILILSTCLLPYYQPYLTCAVPSFHSSLLSFPGGAAPSSAPQHPPCNG